MILPLLTMANIENITLHVSTTGSDRNPGTVQKPLQTLDGARLAARQQKGKTITIEFEKGTYRQSKTVIFEKEDSGNITFRAKKGAEVVFTGSAAFKPQWEEHHNGIFKCTPPKGFDTDQLFINGEAQTLARYPNEDPSIRIFHGYSKDATSKERIQTWKDSTGGYLHAMHAYLWGDFHYRILGKEPNGELKLEGGWQNNRPMGLHPDYRFVEGIFEELDAPGEWFLDKAIQVLYWMPRKGMDLTNTVVEGPQLPCLIELNGVSGVRFSGITFQHTQRTFMDNREPLLRSDWTTYRGGAVHIKNAQNCQIEDSVFENLGGTAIFVDGFNRKIDIKRCRIENVGANGVAFVGSPAAVRNPLFDYNQHQRFTDIDKEKGPKTEDHPADCLVEDCLITRTGRVEKQTAPVQIAMSRRITVRHCSIYDVPRAGINIGDGCWGGHVIEGCDVFDTVLETGDHGSFNSWGRDRYWGLTDVDMNLGQRPELADLDAMEPTIIRNNRWRCDHGWDIDLDDGSSNYIIQNNLCLNGGIKNREGFRRVVENNIMVGNSFHPHVWFLNSGDEFRRNIVFTAYQPIQVPTPWGKEVDDNFLQLPGVLDASKANGLAQQSGRDQHSLQGDALFINPGKGDFRVKAGSPVLKLGFKNFPMDGFGVRTPALRKRTRVPAISGVAAETQLAETTNWEGALLKDLVELGDISATGSTEGAGVMVTQVTPGSKADKLGLKPLDVIRAVDGVAVHSVKEWLTAIKKHPAGVLSIWRKQREMQLNMPR